MKFDPLRAAREFTLLPHPRRGIATNTQWQLNGIYDSLAVIHHVLGQPPGNQVLEVVHELPSPSELDIGRQVMLQLPGETLTQIYVGVLGPDGEVFWQLMAAGVEVGGDTSPEFTFVGHVSGAGVTQPPTACWSNSNEIYFLMDTLDIRRYTRSTGSITTAVAGLPSGSNTGQGVMWLSGLGYYLTIPAANNLEFFSGSGSVLNAPTAKNYWAIYHDSTTSTIFTTSVSDNAAHKMNRTTRAIISTFGSGLSGPKGIATDSVGSVYIADTGNNRIRKYSSALSHLVDFGSAGSGNGQFSSPMGLAFDSGDRLYVADSGNDRVQVFDTNGTFLGKFGSFGSGSAQFDNPVGVHVSGLDITVVDRGNVRLSLWSRA